MSDRPAAEAEFSEQAEGPLVVALRGSDDEASEFRLGTREHDWHRHVRGQLFCVEAGLVHVRTKQGSWLLPPHRAGWIPPGELHHASVHGVPRGWCLAISPQAAAAMPPQPCVMALGELMRALARRAASWPSRGLLDESQQRLIAVLLDEACRAPRETLHLPMPTDRRLLRIALAVLSQPGDTRTQADWAAWAGLSLRTLARLFRAETAVSFAQWRQQARLLQALERLAQGEPVAVVADALGYATPSNFIAMFRRCFGVPPARYFSERPREP
jgi:AraC-like DNA-binding protein